MAIATKLGILGFSGSLTAILISVLHNYSPSQYNPELTTWTWGATSSFFFFSFLVFFQTAILNPPFWIFQFWHYILNQWPEKHFFLRFAELFTICRTYAENLSKIVIFLWIQKMKQKKLACRKFCKKYILQFYVLTNWKKFVTAIWLVLYEQSILFEKSDFFRFQLFITNC